ncbi:coiled-coil domain-containing protein 34-like [Drosophila serrata]|uniref:coiled-coil domain-containing protein 34-like n=1 Tax=Drosophila serrata TaxID=7274 RepID=UPI000A1D30E3|nr:coiled-coil domain-containing protein 34-like [Drosophila serrata]
MAFLGHIDCEGTMISRELFCSGGSKNQSQQDDIETIEGSRTYIKTFDQKSLLQAMGSPSTVRYVASSESSSEMHSLDETESSIFRRCLLESQRTLLAENEEYADDQELETETICLHLGSPRSSSGSNNTSSNRSSNSRESEDQEKSSTTSMCSWEEAMSRGESSQEETRNFSVPSLHLGSHRGSAPMTYTRRLHPQRLERPADEAYENWLSAKQQQAKYRRQAEQKSKEEQLQRAELRQRLSQERFPPAAMGAGKTEAGGEEASAAANAEQRRQQENLKRQQQADQAFQRWMSHVDQRPKPVPSSQGINSLRGTISELYINPNRWVD